MSHIRKWFGILVLGLFGVSLAQTEITLWGDWSGEGEQQILTMVNAFNEAQSDVKVNYVVQQDMVTKFLTAATTGQTPDVMIWDRFITSLYAPKNVLAPINEYLERDGIDTAGFYEQAVRELSYGENIYGLPLTVDARALFYNKKLLEEAGVEPPTTWEELRTAAIALTKRDESGKLIQSGFAMNDVGLFNMWLQQAGGSMLSEDLSTATFNSEAGLAVLNFWNQLLNEDKIYELGFGSGEGEGQDPFVTGKIAMGYNGPWALNGLKKYGSDELDFGVVPPPAGPNGDTGALMGGFGLAIPAASKNKDAAWEFIKWWLTDKDNALLWAKTSNNIPGNLEAVADPFFQDDPYLKPIVDTLAFAKIRPPTPGYPPLEGQAVIPNVQLFLEGKQDAQTALDNALKDGQRILEENSVQ
jgi:multiple sugar transport system substrate-binding protein